MPFIAQQNVPSDRAELFTQKLLSLISKGVVPSLAGGMLPRQDGASTVLQDLSLVYRGSMVLVYRLLVLLTAEARALLPLTAELYAPLSLRALLYAPQDYDAAAHLERLTLLMHTGDDVLGIAPYPGQLFCTMPSNDPDAPLAAEIRWLRAHPPDSSAIRRALQLLTGPGGIPPEAFDMLDAHHLGRLHEHLLAHRLRSGGVGYHLEESRRGRRTTSSFYTPAHIVRHIVEHTLGPLLDERFLRLQAHISVHGIDSVQDALDILLDLHVLDPAMGTGYFLVEGLRFLSEAVTNHLQAIGYIPPDMLALRRQIARRCLYGVDVDPLVVELAVLSLGLTTAVPGMPLLTVDHHLRCGDAVVGTLCLSRTIAPGTVHWELLQAAAVTRQAVISTPGETPTAARMMRLTLAASESALMPLSSLLDAQIMPRRGSLPTTPGRIFHWALAFPQCFADFARGHWKEGGGFDAVIGNPPYDVVVNTDGPRAQAYIRWVKGTARYQPALGGRMNLFRVMMAQGHALLAEGGILGQIVPLGLLTDRSSSQLRRLLIGGSQPLRIDCFPQKDDSRRRVFPEAKLSTCIYIGRRGSSSHHFMLRVYPGGDFHGADTLQLNREDVARFDPHGFTIPLLSDAEFQILLRLQRQHPSLAGIAVTRQGEVNLTLHRESLSDVPGRGRLVRGSEVGRYRLQPPSQGQRLWVDMQSFRLNAARLEDVQSRRVVTQHITGIDDARRLNAVLIESGVLCANSVNYTRLQPLFSPYFGLALLNARLLDWRFRATSSNNNANAYEIDALPVPEIHFNTDVARREMLAEKGRKLYGRCLSEGHTCVLEFSAYHLRRGERDVIHDLLAFLAGQMIDLHHQHNLETDRFLHWLEVEIEASIDGLTGKRALCNYADAGLSFAAFYGRLCGRSNRQRIRVDLDDPARKERIRHAYDTSRERLQPIRERVATTDRLIDQIVYQLYDLSAQEIALIEERY